jgi:hypothetical protein
MFFTNIFSLQLRYSECVVFWLAIHYFSVNDSQCDCVKINVILSRVRAKSYYGLMGSGVFKVGNKFEI